MNKLLKNTAFLLTFATGTISFSTARPAVYDIEASPIQEDQILITWKLPKWTSGEKPTGLFIFRDTKPIENIQGMVPIATAPTYVDTYADIPGDFREYFYAVLVTTNPSIETQYLVNGIYYYDEQIDALPSDESELLLPGINCTTKGTRILGILHSSENLEILQKNRLMKSAKEKDYSGLLREKPLPYMEFPGSLPKNKSSISEEAKQNLVLLIDEYNPQKRVLEVYLFPEEKNAKKDIIPTRNLLTRNFERAEKDLNRFLSKRKPGTPEYNRAMFYLGECKYFTGDFASATKTFARLQDFFPKQCQEWARSSLDLMEN